MEATEAAVLASACGRRRTVRTFDASPLSPEAHELLETLASHDENPYGIPVDLRLIDAETYGASSRVIRGTTLYVVGSLSRCAHAEEAFGYVVERLILAATLHGLGTAWLAGTIDRPAFERAVGVDENRIMPAVIAVGTPAARMSSMKAWVYSWATSAALRPSSLAFLMILSSTSVTFWTKVTSKPRQIR